MIATIGAGAQPLLYATATRVLAAATPSPTTSTSGEGKKASGLGLAVILILCVACYFLFRSMSRHMRKVQGGFSRSGGARSGSQPNTDPPPADRPAALDQPDVASDPATPKPAPRPPGA